MLRIPTRVLAAARKIASKTVDKLAGVCLVRRGVLGTAVVAADKKWLLEVLLLDAHGAGPDETVLPPEAVAEAVRWDRPDVTFSVEGERAHLSGLANDVGFIHRSVPYPPIDAAIETIFKKDLPRRRYVVFDLHVLGQMLDALRRVHPEHRKVADENRPVLCYLYLLAESKALGIRVVDSATPGLSTRAAVMPLVAGRLCDGPPEDVAPLTAARATPTKSGGGDKIGRPSASPTPAGPR